LRASVGSTEAISEQSTSVSSDRRAQARVPDLVLLGERKSNETSVSRAAWWPSRASRSRAIIPSSDMQWLT
jgi:hypothetical protein